MSIKTVLHKPGQKFPFKEESGCAASYCHGVGLDGGVAEIDEKTLITSSCFQCHDTKWSDEAEVDIQKTKGLLK